MTFRSGFVSADDERWANALYRTSHDIYQMPQVVEMVGNYRGDGPALAYIAEDDDSVLLMPLHRRDIPRSGGLMDVISPRGPSGPVVGGSNANSPEFIDRALSTFRTDLWSEGYVSAFVRLHPLLSPPTDLLSPHGRLVHHVDSVTIDLSLSEEQLWQQTP